MLRLLLLIALGWVIVKYLLPPLLAQFTPRPGSGAGPAPKTPETGDMVRCAHCQVFVLRSEAIYSQDRFYCCPEHRAAGPR
jgi:uncharacterized protein